MASLGDETIFLQEASSKAPVAMKEVEQNSSNIPNIYHIFFFISSQLKFGLNNLKNYISHTIFALHPFSVFSTLKL